MKNVFATIGFVTIIVGAYSLGEKKGYKKAVNECHKEISKLTKQFVDEGLMKESCEFNVSGK